MSAITKSATELKGLGLPWRPFIVVDPGRRCGINVVRPAKTAWLGVALHDVATYPLEELPDLLRQLVSSALLPGVAFVVCEDYTLHGGNRRNDPKMPASQGIGICRAICALTDTQLYLIQPNQKAPAAWARPADAEARARCRNEHERDVVDLAITVLRNLEAGR